MNFSGIFAIPMFLFSIALPALILYFIIKMAVKHAISELKNEGRL
jgi:LytS/YehU family sensor histidine kinase